MKIKLILAFALFTFLPATSTAVPTTYRYTGGPYQEFEGPASNPYTMSMKLVGSITLNAAIPPLTTLTLEGSSDQVLDWTFTDGVIEHSKRNDYTQGADLFVLETDASGDIRDWGINVGRWFPAFPDGASIYSEGRICEGIFQCDHAVIVMDGTQYTAGSLILGTWTISPVPEPSTYVLLFVGIAVVRFASFRHLLS